MFLLFLKICTISNSGSGVFKMLHGSTRHSTTASGFGSKKGDKNWKLISFKSELQPSCFKRYAIFVYNNAMSSLAVPIFVIGTFPEIAHFRLLTEVYCFSQRGQGFWIICWQNTNMVQSLIELDYNFPTRHISI